MNFKIYKWCKIIIILCDVYKIKEEAMNLENISTSQALLTNECVYFMGGKNLSKAENLYKLLLFNICGLGYPSTSSILKKKDSKCL